MSEPEYEHRSFRIISKSFGFSHKAGLKSEIWQLTVYSFLFVANLALIHADGLSLFSDHVCVFSVLSIT